MDRIDGFWIPESCCKSEGSLKPQLAKNAKGCTSSHVTPCIAWSSWKNVVEYWLSPLKW